MIGIAVFFAVLALACFDHPTALSAPSFQLNAGSDIQRSAVTPANAPSGSLFVAPQSRSGTMPVKPARHLNSNIDVRINGPLARVFVTLEFVNDTQINGRGVFAFPLPENASIDTLTITAGDRRTQGRIVPYDEAEKMQQLLSSAGFPVSLDAVSPAATQTISIDRIDAGEHVTIRFAYVQLLSSKPGAQRFEFPIFRLKNGDRQSRLQTASLDVEAQAARNTDSAISGMSDPMAQVSMRVWLNAGFPIGKVYSPTHAISVRKTSDGSAMLSLSHARIKTDRNFVLIWETETQDAVSLTAFKETTGGGNHLVALLKAGETARSGNLARELILVVDTSGSMKGRSLGQLKESMAGALSELTSRDRFNIIHFNSQSEMLFREAQLLTPQSLGIALNYVAGLDARGGTEALPALDAALADARQKTDQSIRQIVFVTDGEIEDAAEFLARIAERRGRSRLFTVGIGPDISASVMRRAAEIGRGKFVHINNRRHIGPRLEQLLDNLAHPVVTDLRIDWPAGVRPDTWPNPLPDLYADEPLMISSELSALKGDLKVTGVYDGKPWSQSISLVNAADGKGVSTLWARNKIASLHARKYAGQSQADVDAAIEAVAMKHGLPSRRTVLVGFDVSPPLGQSQPLASEELPIEWPSAWVQDGISRHASTMTERNGDSTTSQTKKQITAPMITSSITNRSVEGNAASEIKIAARAGGFTQALGNKGPSSPEVGGQNWTLTIMAIVFSLMTAVTLGLWRHLRQAVRPDRRERRIRLAR